MKPFEIEKIIQQIEKKNLSEKKIEYSYYEKNKTKKNKTKQKNKIKK